jgi:hypothetical protein
LGLRHVGLPPLIRRAFAVCTHARTGGAFSELNEPLLPGPLEGLDCALLWQHYGGGWGEPCECRATIIYALEAR